MPKRSRQPLEIRGREVRLYKGDWDRLEEILAPHRLKPSAFIRELVSKKIRQIEETQTQPMETAYDDRSDELADIITTAASDPDQS
jgi:hypothetical protein